MNANLVASLRALDAAKCWLTPTRQPKRKERLTADTSADPCTLQPTWRHSLGGDSAPDFTNQLVFLGIVYVK